MVVSWRRGETRKRERDEGAFEKSHASVTSSQQARSDNGSNLFILTFGDPIQKLIVGPGLTLDPGTRLLGS